MRIYFITNFRPWSRRTRVKAYTTLCGRLTNVKNTIETTILEFMKLRILAFSSISSTFHWIFGRTPRVLTAIVKWQDLFVSIINFKPNLLLTEFNEDSSENIDSRRIHAQCHACNWFSKGQKKDKSKKAAH